jgi:hypothetical protein
MPRSGKKQSALTGRNNTNQTNLTNTDLFDLKKFVRFPASAAKNKCRVAAKTNCPDGQK